MRSFTARSYGPATPSFLLLASLLAAMGACSRDRSDVSTQAGAATAPPSASAEALETIPEGEDALGRKLAERIAAGVKEDFEASTSGKPLARRGAHVKNHGCVKAELAVEASLPADVRVGVFVPGKRYDAWVRYSNGNGRATSGPKGGEQDDHVGDGRGMAIKLLGVPGDKVLSGDDRSAPTQDFLMINHPAFFVRNAADYAAFMDAIATNGDPRAFFFPSVNPTGWRVREMAAARATSGKVVGNPLDVQYWSMSPYLLGDRAVKVSARPCQTVEPPSSLPTSPNYLREAMVKTLAERSACFELMVQFQGADRAAFPVEDPVEEWDATVSPFVKLATLTIPMQTFDTPAQAAYCENLSFTPWHALPEHRPLGGINRIRRTVYETVSRVRHELNMAPRIEPSDLSVPGT